MQAREIFVDIDGRRHSLKVPADPESAMQASWDEHGEDESYFPFWLEVWPSSFGLYDFLVRNEVPLDGALEVGCGCGTLAQLLDAEPGVVTHTDIVPGACRFAKAQVRNPNRHFVAMDLTRPCMSHAPNLILGADIFYEYSLVERVCDFVRNHLAPSGMALIADPQRTIRPQVPEYIAASGLKSERIIWDYPLDGQKKRVAIWRLSK
jgi:SAM-dependent methyltransferase